MLNKIFIILLIILPICLSQQQCNITHYEFFSKYSLGKQQQLNKTFTQIQPLLKISDVIYAQGPKIYTLNNFSLRFQYLDSKQTASIISDNVILIDGGILQVTVSFDWTEKGIFVPLNGTGVAMIKSSPVTFQKDLQYQKGYLIYKLNYAYDIMFKFSNFTFVKITPPNTTQDVILALFTALNVPSQNNSFKQKLTIQINKIYAKTLQKYINNQHYPLDDHFDYIYYNQWSNKNITINFLLNPKGYLLTIEGLSLYFVSKIKDDQKWKCGKVIPTTPYTPSVYGGLQQFISTSIIQNTLRYAFQKHYLDSFLNRINWESSYFQFFAGDLFQVIPNLANRFISKQKVQGNCIANTIQQPIVKRHTKYTINTTTPYNCDLNINGTKIVELQVQLNLTIQLSANITHLNLKIIQVQGTPKFKPVPTFEISNQPLAQIMFSRSLNRLKQGYTFGSGWKAFPRDYPHLIIEDDFFLIYDSSHTNTTKSTTTIHIK